jgi:hypothetical protein
MTTLIAGTESLVTSTALTPITAFKLDQAGIATVLRAEPELGSSLEAQARRGQAWLRCEAAAHEEDHMEKPDLLLARLRQFLRRLNG